MTIDRYFKKCGDKLYGPYTVLRQSLGRNKRVSFYVKKGLTPEESLMSDPIHAADFFQKIDEYRGGKRKSVSSQKKGGFHENMAHGEDRTYYGKAVSEIMLGCGFTLQGRRMLRGASYYDISSATRRFSLLNQADRALVRSPQGLLDLEMKARILVKRANAKRIPASFESCFAEALNTIQ
jgi:hypothetical protein